jgi:hypothetical protein
MSNEIYIDGFNMKETGRNVVNNADRMYELKCSMEEIEITEERKYMDYI